MTEITTNSGFTFTPPEHIMDDWNFMEILARMAGGKRTDGEIMADYFDISEMIFGADGIEKLKEHVKRTAGYVSFQAMMGEINEAIAALKNVEKNSLSLPE